jgi:hypothetical protein
MERAPRKIRADLAFTMPAVQLAEPKWPLWTTQVTLAQVCLNFRFGRGPARAKKILNRIFLPEP